MSSEKDRILGSGAASKGAVILILPLAPSLYNFLSLSPPGLSPGEGEAAGGHCTVWV